MTLGCKTGLVSHGPGQEEAAADAGESRNREAEAADAVDDIVPGA